MNDRGDKKTAKNFSALCASDDEDSSSDSDSEFELEDGQAGQGNLTSCREAGQSATAHSGDEAMISQDNESGRI